jgi:DNA polymerase-3 subunit epsilon
MNFVVVDVETANADLSSICQIGIASFAGGAFDNGWVTLVNPDDYFSPVNIAIHQIDELLVRDSPTWDVIFGEVVNRLENEIVVSHTPFDRAALSRACDRYRLQAPNCTWLDSARVVRRAWPEFSRSGYGLSNVANRFAIDYRAHDALEDARCAGLLLLKAISDTGVTLEQWLARVKLPIGETEHGHNGHKREGSLGGDFFGQTLVFTGSLSVPRHEAADLASAAGFCVDDAVTKHTTMLVVGDQDLRRLAGHEKSSKHLKAERLITDGQQIRILGESDFLRIVSPNAG